ncbi:hypothetical protein CEUSTIGMA_g2981.t1 [Chlamydomonas eustigma]|uniref:Uncharacterized protein n=1 Tax=Chlamydomonas eustigma TaxID=1157962 RepID=A0A250WXG9_9CHLO|nr:hypothetical protein CEUSTIGMA_g2981.t1 [Chlamydomonas eustigma]|eukprot:GAX75538.1 hypothetical protein CEUSTIGMA_g2981.t1 [Chlamydomonas eustigma]
MTSYSYDTSPLMSSPLKDVKIGGAKKGYADQYAQRSQTSGFHEYYPSSSKKTVSVLHRPKLSPSRKNMENIDVQFEKDKDAFAKRATTYRRLAGEKYHHNRTPSSIITLWEAGHIVDRGRGKGDGVVYDPIHHDFKVPPPAGVETKHGRPQSAPRPHQGDMRLQIGSYNPILHTFSQPPDATYQNQKEKEFSRQHGHGSGSGVAITADPERAAFDPILGQPKPVTESQLQRARPASAPRTAYSAVPAERPATPGRRPRQAAGDSWGTYNPILHNWLAPPSDTRFHDQNAALNQQSGISGAHHRKAEPPRNQGVYNPILNTWTVPPANPRIIQGLSFTPASVFTQPGPSTPRV